MLTFLLQSADRLDNSFLFGCTWPAAATARVRQAGKTNKTGRDSSSCMCCIRQPYWPVACARANTMWLTYKFHRIITVVLWVKLIVQPH